MFRKTLVVLFLVALSTGSYFAYSTFNAGEAESAKPVYEDRQEIYHNSPYEVEQVTPSGCYDASLPNPYEPCATNTGPCVYDPDDRLQAFSWDGELQTCMFADHVTHSYFVTMIVHKKQVKTAEGAFIRVTLDPPVQMVGPTPHISEFYFDNYTQISGRDVLVSGCFTIDLSTAVEQPYVLLTDEVAHALNPEYATDPNEELGLGGGGGVLGTAVPMTLTYTFPDGGALGVDKRSVERCP